MPSVICGGCRTDLLECKCDLRYQWVDGKRVLRDAAPERDLASALEYISDTLREIVTELAEIKEEIRKVKNRSARTSPSRSPYALEPRLRKP